MANIDVDKVKTANAIWDAVLQDKLADVETLLSGDPSLRMWRTADGSIALHLAVSLPMVARLLEQLGRQQALAEDKYGRKPIFSLLEVIHEKDREELVARFQAVIPHDFDELTYNDHTVKQWLQVYKKPEFKWSLVEEVLLAGTYYDFEEAIARLDETVWSKDEDKGQKPQASEEKDRLKQRNTKWELLVTQHMNSQLGLCGAEALKRVTTVWNCIKMMFREGDTLFSKCNHADFTKAENHSRALLKATAGKKSSPIDVRQSYRLAFLAMARRRDTIVCNNFALAFDTSKAKEPDALIKLAEYPNPINFTQTFWEDAPVAQVLIKNDMVTLFGDLYPRSDCQVSKLATSGLKHPAWIKTGDLTAGIEELITMGGLVKEESGQVIFKQGSRAVREVIEEFTVEVWRKVESAELTLQKVEDEYILTGGFAELGLPENQPNRWQVRGLGDGTNLRWKPTADNYQNVPASGANTLVCLRDLYVRLSPLHALWLREMCNARQTTIASRMRMNAETALGRPLEEGEFRARPDAKAIPRAFEKLKLKHDKLFGSVDFPEARLKNPALDKQTWTLGCSLTDLNGVEIICNSITELELLYRTWKN